MVTPKVIVTRMKRAYRTAASGQRRPRRGAGIAIPAAAYPTGSPAACRPTPPALRTGPRDSPGDAGSTGGPSIKPCFSDRTITAHDPQAQFDQLGIARVDLEARAQSM